jgi:hypothetical protein
MNAKKNRKIVLGVLNRVAAYKNARKGTSSPSSVQASMDIDHKLLWRWRMVSETEKDDEPSRKNKRRRW